MKDKKIDYPDKRKPRKTEYSKTYKLIDRYGLDTIREIWVEKGMYRAAKELEASPYVIRYVARKYGWQRPAEKAPAILKGVQNGKLDPDQYKTLDFSNTNLNQTNEENNNE